MPDDHEINPQTHSAERTGATSLITTRNYFQITPNINIIVCQYVHIMVIMYVLILYINILRMVITYMHKVSTYL